MGDPVVHWEFWSKDPSGVSEFYKNVFDRNIQFIPEMSYHVVHTENEDGIDGGIMQPEEGPWPGNMALYISVEDLVASGAKIVAAGGEIIVEQMDVPGMGSFSLFADPEGRVLGIWKQAAPSGDEEE